MTSRTIFLDDGGVMNDNVRRAAEWQRLVSEFLSPRLGGSTAAWSQANQVVFDAQWQRFEAWLRQRKDFVYADFFTSRPERQRWLGEMCEHVGVVAPSPTELMSLAEETQEYVLPRVRAAFAEVAGALRALSSVCTLATASGESSYELERYLIGMDVRELFSDLLYGPDLVRTFKDGARYYRRVFAHAGIDPADALVVDDSPTAVAWAGDAGAIAVLVVRDGAAPPKNNGAVIRDLTELLPLVESMG